MSHYYLVSRTLRGNQVVFRVKEFSSHSDRQVVVDAIAELTPYDLTYRALDLELAAPGAIEYIKNNALIDNGFIEVVVTLLGLGAEA